MPVCILMNILILVPSLLLTDWQTLWAVLCISEMVKMLTFQLQQRERDARKREVIR
jgi:hypothetical protein